LRASIVVPSRGCKYLEYLLKGLRGQSVKPYEVVIVIKECNAKAVESLCIEYDLPCIIIEQLSGYFTHALNIGKKEARGDIVIFTDDDAIPLKKWIERYIKLHRKYHNVAGISSRDLYLDLNSLRIVPTPDDRVTVRLYRWFVRPWLEPPHKLLKKYRLGVYLTKTFDVAHGPFIPNRACYSLPFRGVNMSFKASYVYNIWFPEHELLKRAPGNEQYFGLQLVIKGFDIIHIPNNPVLHIARYESLSRLPKRSKHKLFIEFRIVKSLYRALIESHS